MGESPIVVTLSAAGLPSFLAAALTTPIHAPYNDVYEVNAPLTPTVQQRQQPRRTHIEAASAGISPPRSRIPSAEPKHNPQLTTDFEEDDSTSTLLAPSLPHHSPEAARRPHRPLRISKNRGSAILYALEEALRHPNPFTPDLVEENAQMSDIVGGGQPATASNGRTGSGRPQVAPGATGSPGIRGPRDIMREREARQRRKAEEAARQEMERIHAEEEARQMEESQRKVAAAAGAAEVKRGSGESSQRGPAGTAGPRISDNSQRSDRRSGERLGSGDRQQDQPLQALGSGGRAIGGGHEAQPATRPRPAQSQQQRQPQQETTRPGQAPQDPTVPIAAQPPQVAFSGVGTRSSFPHAFERWETLSAHWEGLTSFWIRRLEENSREISREPISQQLARQVTDLSAAGANLFHAVVELQRLRASSERKFQRWFFETRAEQERAQELQAMTQASLEAERRDRAAAIAEAVALESTRYNADSQLAEMRRELQISKEEARRAWEELGRREQEERERTASLRDGQPTIVGGVQVVPMMQGVPSRHESARDTSQSMEGAYTRGDAVQEPEGPVDDSDVAYQQYSRAQRAGPADPFVEQQTTPTGRTARSGRVTASEPSSYQEYTQAPAVQPVSSSAFYQQRQGTSLHPTESTSRSEHSVPYGASAPSEGAYSEEEYEIDAEGQFVRDERGNKVRYQNPASDDDVYEYDATAASERELAYLRGHGVPTNYAVDAPPSRRAVAPTSHPTTTGPVDYSGEGYGSGWEAVPRHHHPTRLSDVLEEDERSRTSASQVSRRD